MYRTYLLIVIQVGLLVQISAANRGRIQRPELAGVLVNRKLEDLARRRIEQVQRIVCAETR